MTIQDLSNNRSRIVKNIQSQITLATTEQIKGVMTKMINLLYQFEDQKATMANIDKLTRTATVSYIKHDLKFTNEQNVAIDRRIELNKKQNMPSSLQR